MQSTRDDAAQAAREWFLAGLERAAMTGYTVQQRVSQTRVGGDETGDPGSWLSEFYLTYAPGEESGWYGVMTWRDDAASAWGHDELYEGAAQLSAADTWTPPARMGADISLPDGEEATRPGEGARPGA